LLSEFFWFHREALPWLEGMIKANQQITKVF
jgi:hypothetical protein